jgi:hypothetical protein
VLNRKGSGLVAQHFANKQGRVLQWDIEKPEFHTPQAVTPDLYQERDREIENAMKFIGLSPQITSGARDPGVTAGVAIRAKENQADARHLSPGQTLEQLVVDVAYLLLEVDKEIEPELYVAGKLKAQDWQKFDMERGDTKLLAWPVSSIPTEPEGRYQQIAEEFANGQITKQEKMLLDGRPDVDAFDDLATAMQSHVMQALDDIMRTGKLAPPDAYENWDTVIPIAQSYLKLQEVRRAPDDRLRLIEQWIDLAFDIKQNPGALPVSTGVQPPQVAIQTPGQAPAPPPMQTPASLPRPSQLAPPPVVQ